MNLAGSVCRCSDSKWVWDSHAKFCKIDHAVLVGPFLETDDERN